MNVASPISIYAAAKASSELFSHVYSSQFGLNVTILRFFTVYGPNQRPEMGIHKFVTKIDRDENIELYGDGTSSRDYTYVDDIVEGIVASISLEEKFGIYNLGNNKEVKLIELIGLIEEELGKKAKIIYVANQKGDVDHTLADISKAEKDFNYHPKITISEGIKLFVKWYNKQQIEIL